MTKITEDHLNALHEAVYPMQFHKNREGLRKTMLVRDVLDILKREVNKKSDPEIAASLQNLTKCENVEEWVSETGEIFHWTQKGFVATGGYRWKQKESPEHCRCTYPKQNGVLVQGVTICGKCKKQLF